MSDLTKRESASLATSTTFKRVHEVNVALQEAQEKAHLISPATSIDVLPEGCGIALSMVHVDVSKNERGYFNSDDTYDVGGGGKRGLSKTVLNKIAAALGISWDPYASRRIDDGSDPYYCRWLAVGQYRAFDGQVQTVSASKEMDLRAGSPQVEGLMQRYKAALADPQKRAKAKDPTGQIREMRLHIQAHAETKAQLRAIRSLGIKTAYPVHELRKPFAAARVMFTGETSDPELKRMFAEKTAESFLGASRSLYGASPAASPQAVPSTVVTQQLSAPPPVGASLDPDDDEFIDTHGEVHKPAAQKPKNASAPQEARPVEGESSDSSSGERARPDTSSEVLRFGNSKGKPIAEAATSDLEWMVDFVGTKIANNDTRYPEKDQQLVDALNAEIEFRKAEKF